MGKKLGLDKQYSSLLTSVNKNSPSGVLSKVYKSIGTFPNVSGVANSKLLNVGKKVFSKTPIGRAVNLAVNVGSGIGIGYSYAKNKFNKKKADFQKGDYSDIKTDKKMSGGMMQGYGAARTSGMGLEDQSLPPGKMVRASKGKMAKRNRGGGMDAGAAQGRVDRIRAVYKLAKKNKGEDRLTQSDIKMAEKTLKAYESLKKNK